MQARVLCIVALVATSPAWGSPPLTAQQRKVLDAQPEDVLDKKPCVGTRLAATNWCRDAYHHVHTNEWHHHLFEPFISKLGGGYVGVGSDQGLTFAAAMQATVAWLVDYDPQVVWVNRIHKAFLLHSPDAATFLRRWSDREAAQQALRLAFGEERELREAQTAYRLARRDLVRYFKQVMRLRKRYHWLHFPERYRYVQVLAQQGRLRILKGDLLKERALAGIAHAARQLKLPIRVVYLSNAEDYWRYRPQFRKNMAALPMDDKSVVLRTRSPRKPVREPTLGRYLYVVQQGQDFQRRIVDRLHTGVWSMLQQRKPRTPPGFFTVALR